MATETAATVVGELASNDASLKLQPAIGQRVCQNVLREEGRGHSPFIHSFIPLPLIRDK